MCTIRHAFTVASYRKSAPSNPTFVLGRTAGDRRRIHTRAMCRSSLPASPTSGRKTLHGWQRGRPTVGNGRTPPANRPSTCLPSRNYRAGDATLRGTSVAIRRVVGPGLSPAPSQSIRSSCRRLFRLVFVGFFAGSSTPATGVRPDRPASCDPRTTQNKIRRSPVFRISARRNRTLPAPLGRAAPPPPGCRAANCHHRDCLRSAAT